MLNEFIIRQQSRFPEAKYCQEMDEATNCPNTSRYIGSLVVARPIQFESFPINVFL